MALLKQKIELEERSLALASSRRRLQKTAESSFSPVKGVTRDKTLPEVALSTANQAGSSLLRATAGVESAESHPRSAGRLLRAPPVVEKAESRPRSGSSMLRASSVRDWAESLSGTETDGETIEFLNRLDTRAESSACAPAEQAWNTVPQRKRGGGNQELAPVAKVSRKLSSSSPNRSAETRSREHKHSRSRAESNDESQADEDEIPLLNTDSSPSEVEEAPSRGEARSELRSSRGELPQVVAFSLRGNESKSITRWQRLEGLGR